MASGSTSRGGGSGARGGGRSRARRAAAAPSSADGAAGAALLAPQLNPTFVAMPAAELVAHLNRYRRTDDFVDAALVFAARERRLAEAEGLVRAGNERADRLRDEIRALEHRAHEADAQIRRAADTEAALRARITAALISGISGGGGGHAQQEEAAGHGREPVPDQEFIAVSDDDDGLGFDDDATGVQTTMAADAEGEVVVGDDVPMKTTHGALGTRGAPHLVVAPLPDTLIDDDERQAEQVAATNAARMNRAAPDLVAAPLPDMLIDDDERQVEQQFATNFLSSNEVAQGDDHEVSEDVLGARVTAGCGKVSEAEAQGEDMATSTHKRSQGKQQAARPTKKARRQKMTCFYNDVFSALKKKEDLIRKQESLAIAKKAAASTSKQLHCTCWCSEAPYTPSKADAVEEDSGDDSQN